MNFDVLDRKLNIFSKRLLEASAGTGKTFAIEHLVVRLILESPHLNIEQILVVTFTRAATRELKSRIRANLEKVLSFLKKREGVLDYVQAYLERDEMDRQAAIRRIEDALSYFDQAQVFTIHGFCHRMLSEFAFDASVGFNIADPDLNQHQLFLKSALKDFLRTAPS